MNTGFAMSHRVDPSQHSLRHTHTHAANCEVHEADCVTSGALKFFRKLYDQKKDHSTKKYSKDIT